MVTFDRDFSDTPVCLASHRMRVRTPGTIKHASVIAKEVLMPCGLQVPPP